MNKTIYRLNHLVLGVGLLAFLFSGVTVSSAAIVPFDTTNIQDFLIISKAIDSGTDSIAATGGGQGTYGTNTLGWVRELPSSAVALPGTIASPETVAPTFDGDIAMVGSDLGEMNYQDLNVYGAPDEGVVGKNTINGFTDNLGNLSNSFFDNDDGNGLQNFVSDRGLEQMAPAGTATTTRDVDDFADEINDARLALLAMESMAADVNIVADGSGNIKTVDNYVTLPNPGVNIVKFTGVGANDITVDSVNLVIQAPNDATPGDRQAIVFIPDTANFKTSNGNVLVGQNMGMQDVVFVSFREDNATHFDFSNTVLKGVAFWDLYREVDGSSDKSEISLDNVSGCTQLLGDKISLSSEIHLGQCGEGGFIGIVPAPSSLALTGLAALTLLATRRRMM